MKTSGQRLFVKSTAPIDCWPCQRSMSRVNSAAWYYKIADDVLVIETAAAANAPRVRSRPFAQGSRTTLFYERLFARRIEGLSRRYEISGTAVAFRFPKRPWLENLSRIFFPNGLNATGNVSFTATRSFSRTRGSEARSSPPESPAPPVSARRLRALSARTRPKPAPDRI